MAACAGASDQPVSASDDSTTPTETSDQQTAASNEAAIEVGDDSDEPSATIERVDDEPSVNDSRSTPIADALGFDPDDSIELNNNFIRSAEELVRQCMAAAGFEYVPQDPGFAPSFERQLELEQSISEEQFLDDYGYGISTLFELNFQDEGVMGFVESLVGPPPIDARTPSEEEAYQLALYGETIQGLTAEELQEQAFEVTFDGASEGSCRATSYANADNPQGEIFNGLQSLLGDELDQLPDQFENDPRVRVAVADWQSCMAALGYSYTNADEIRSEIEDDANAIGGRLQQSPEALAMFAQAIEANLTEMDRDTRYDFLEQVGAFQGFSMVPGLQAELDELIEFELVIARESYDCSDQETLRQVQFEVEQAFVEQHADQLALVVSGNS